MKEVLKSDNIDEIKLKTKDLGETIQKIGAELYKNQPKTDEPKKDENNAEEGKYKETK